MVKDFFGEVERLKFKVKKTLIAISPLPTSRQASGRGRKWQGEFFLEGDRKRREEKEIGKGRGKGDRKRKRKKRLKI